MIGSIYVGLSGLSAFSNGLRTISNNVANMNVPGYKSVDVRFAEVRSGIETKPPFGDSKQLLDVGYGVRVAETRIDFSQGALSASTGEFDLAIDGPGFLVLRDSERIYYARTGEFSLDDDGFLIDRRSGYRLAALGLQPVDLNALQEIPGAATSRIQFSGNLSSGSDEAVVSNITVFDSNGESASWDVTLVPADTPGISEWIVTVTDDAGSELGSGRIRFIGSQIDVSTAEITIETGDDESGRFAVVLDFSEGVTSADTGSSSSVRAAEVDGSEAGTLSTLTVDENGAIEIAYSNGETRIAETIALATFDDPQLLEQIGDGLFVHQGRAGVTYGASSGDGPGTLVSGRLEGSNVDVSREFSNLVLIQRGFQASSQIVTISNEMIEELYSIADGQ